MKTRNLLALALLAIALLVGGGIVMSRARHQRAGPALYTAASYGRTDEALSLIEGGADANFRNPQFSDTPLHAAAAGGFDAIVTALLKHGANLGAANKYGETPLHYAASRGRVSTVQLLLAKGANPRVLNKFGRTPLQNAAGFLKLRHPSPRERAAYPQVVAILQAAEAKAR